MSIARLVRIAARDIKHEPWALENEDTERRAIYLGTYMYLDPCGRYHHVLAPNGLKRKCERYWEDLERRLEAEGLCLEAGEGSATDVFAVEYRLRHPTLASSPTGFP